MDVSRETKFAELPTSFALRSVNSNYNLLVLRIEKHTHFN